MLGLLLAQKDLIVDSIACMILLIMLTLHHPRLGYLTRASSAGDR